MPPELTFSALDLFFNSHPWHGVDLGKAAPERVAVRVEIAALAEERTGRRPLVGDDDPLDILVLTEKTITHGNILVPAIPIGGLGLLDGDEVDDKIVAVLANDAVYGGVTEIGHLPSLLVNRLKHYFLTYEQGPDQAHPACEITRVYGRGEAHEVVRRSQQDYMERFGAVLGDIVEARP